MNTQTTYTTLTAPRADIHTADVQLVRLQAGSYLAIDTQTGAAVGRATKTDSGWMLTGGQDVQDRYTGWTRPKHQDHATYYKRLATIIPQWARGYC